MTELTPEQIARLEQQRALNQQLQQQQGQLQQQYGGALPDSQYRMLTQAYNQYTAQGGTLPYAEFGRIYIESGRPPPAGDASQFTPYAPPATDTGTNRGGLLEDRFNPSTGTENNQTITPGMPVSTPNDGTPQTYNGLPVSVPIPGMPTLPTTRGPDYTGLPSGPRVNPTQPGPQLPPGPAPNPVPGNTNPLASFGYTQGPNGEIIPLMLQQGMNPFQSPNTAGGLLGFSGKTDELRMPQLQFNPQLQQPQWYTPPTPHPPRDMVNDPWVTPPTGDAPPSIAPPQTGGPPRTGPYYAQPGGGLLGLPPALSGLLR